MSRLSSVLGVLFAVSFLAGSALFPCLPAREPNGDIFALSRFDYALVYLAHPETVWAQWTNNGRWDFWGIRSQAILPFAFQLLVILAVGYSIRFAISLNSFPFEPASMSLAYLLGYTYCHGLHYPQLAFLGRVTTGGSFGLIATSMVVFVGIGCRHHARSTTDMSRCDVAKDDSLIEAWKRRLMGLFLLGLGVICVLQLLGAMLPSVDKEVRMGTWEHTLHSLDRDTDSHRNASWFEYDLLGRVWMGFMDTSWRANLEPSSMDGPQSLGIPAHYPVLISSKLALFFVLICGHFLMWRLCRMFVGKLPSLVTLFLLFSTPAFVELGRFGRHECLVYASLAAVLYLSCTRSFRDWRDWSALGIVGWPLLQELVIVYGQTRNDPEVWFDPLMRFLGFSPLHSVPFIACVILGVINRRDRLVTRLASLGCLVFLVVGWLLSKPDRSWISCIGLLALPAAFGVDWLIKHQTRWVGLPMWGFVLVLSIVNVAVWPTMENRILASADVLISEQWDIFDDVTSQSSKATYIKELRRQYQSGKIKQNSKIGLLGVTDDLDVPVACFLIGSDNLKQERWKELGLTHLAIVSPNDPNRRLLSFDEELALRSKVQEYVEAGVLDSQAVSGDCFELNLFVVSQPSELGH